MQRCAAGGWDARGLDAASRSAEVVRVMSRAEEQGRPPLLARRAQGEYVPLLVLVGATLIGVSVLSPAVWLVLLTDGVYVAALLAAAAGWGAWPVVWLGLGRRPTGQQFCVAAALGFGIMSTAALVLGMAGALSWWAAWGLVGVGWILGVLRLYMGQRGGIPADGRTTDRGVGRRTGPGSPSTTVNAELGGHSVAYASGSERSLLSPAATRETALRSVALLPLAVPLAVALIGATLPPGVLWADEARGYDALEYHLQVPREYFEQGGIHFLPHNVYASFPQQVETQYLLLNYLIGDPLAAAIPAQLLHATLGVLAIVALASWARPGWPRVLVALVTGAVPWLAYLGCLAYVELGVLFFAAVAGGLVLDHFRSELRCDWRTVLAAGLCAGLAGGCKFTAIVLVTVGLGAVWLLTMPGRGRFRLARLGLFSIGAAAALSPWLIRNIAFTGNPVYPFAYKWFGGAAWSVEQDAQWAQGHRLSQEDAAPLSRTRILVDELFKSRLFGPAIWLLPLVAALVTPRRRTGLLVAWAAFIVVVWTTATHMPGRFVVPVVIPLALLLGGVSAPPAKHTRRRILIGATLVLLAWLGAGFNDARLLRLLRAEDARWQRITHTAMAKLVGVPEALERANVINQTVIDPNAYVWLVGDAAVFYVRPHMHYTVPFSRDPWLEYALAGAHPEECVDWLRTQKVTHVVFSWSEIRRLRRTYGFSPVVTPEWVAELAACGLRRVEPSGGTPQPVPVDIYEVAPEN